MSVPPPPLPPPQSSDSEWWDDPTFTEEDLQAIDATIHAATSNNINKPPHIHTHTHTHIHTRTHIHTHQNDAAQCPPKTLSRRLPSSLRLNPSSSSLSHCQGKLKINYPVMNFGGRIIYSRTTSEVEKAAAQLLRFVEAKKIRTESELVALGFDIEWKPTFIKGVPPGKAAVMQICCDTGHCHVMHIIHSGIPRTLRLLLEDSTFLKVGVGVANDAYKIRNDYNITVKGVEDVSSLANQKCSKGPKTWSLQTLTELLVSKQLLKPKKIRLGNWATYRLSKEQLQYAATDAFVSWHLYEVLKTLPDTELDGIAS